MLNANHTHASTPLRPLLGSVLAGRRCDRRRDAWRVKLKCIAAAAVLILPIFAVEVAAAPPTASTCSRVQLATPQPWLASVAWWGTGAERTLLATDMSKNQVLVLDLAGGVRARLLGGGNDFGSGGKSAYALVRPSQLRAGLDGGFLLEDEKLSNGTGLDEIFLLDETLNPTGSLVIKDRRLVGGGRLDVVYDWQPFDRGILAFGDIEYPGPTWKSALFYLDRDTSEIYLELDPNEPEIAFYTMSTQYIAVDGDTGYMLRQTAEPQVVVVRRQQAAQSLAAPSGFRSFSADAFEAPVSADHLAWWDSVSRHQRLAFYERMQASRMIAGLYAWRGSLYFLTKEAAAGDLASTSWSLLRADRAALAAGDVARVEALRLPTTKPSLRVLPGDPWAIVEVDKIRASGRFGALRMDAVSLLTVPSSWVSSSTSPLRTGSAPPSCTMRER